MNLEILLSKILMVLVPFGTFMIIVKYKEKVSHIYLDEQLSSIENYLIDYFNLTDEEINLQIQEDIFKLHPNQYPVTCLGDINVYKNDFPFGSLAQYFLNDQTYAYDLYKVLIKKCKNVKVPRKEMYSYASMFACFQQYLQIQDTTIREYLFQLQNILTILVNEKQMNAQYYRYIMILFDVLERYQKLESVDAIDERMRERTQKVTKKVVRIFSEKAYEQK